MTKFVLSILIILPAMLFADDCKHTKDILKCVKYVRNYDADTITFEIKGIHPLLGHKINVRVSGVDTPEIRAKDKCEKNKAQIAKKLVEKLLKKAKRIDLLNVKRGKYFRIVADVKIDDIDLTDYLISNGHAYSYYGKTKKKMNWCRPAREIASENKKSMK